jgi:hypothetical protein
MTPKIIPAVAPRRVRLNGIVAAVAGIGLAIYGIADRARSTQEVQIWTNEQAYEQIYNHGCHASVFLFALRRLGYRQDWSIWS